MARSYWVYFLSHIPSNFCHRSDHTSGPQPIFSALSYHSLLFLCTPLELGFSKHCNLVLIEPSGQGNFQPLGQGATWFQRPGARQSLQPASKNMRVQGEKMKAKDGRAQLVLVTDHFQQVCVLGFGLIHDSDPYFILCFPGIPTTPILTSTSHPEHWGWGGESCQQKDSFIPIEKLRREQDLFLSMHIRLYAYRQSVRNDYLHRISCKFI